MSFAADIIYTKIFQEEKLNVTAADIILTYIFIDFMKI